jgi:NMD protein affecting ribosome stability and mRNA decay
VEPNTDGYFCCRCGVHRTRTATGLCPSCLDDEKHPERADRKAS